VVTSRFLPTFTTPARSGGIHPSEVIPSLQVTHWTPAEPNGTSVCKVERGLF
jgi:hypothetical protein